ncbi:hypothetical protein F5B22DRAFT_603349 [Xylaria bambusicola]|uniref:uncharacterized protein n=1 Tax=Xylaria bambusicola TaxID=326684 RepID=UPI0020079EB9|nr:uncharacterized protein F5B22DRAFT_603349 [Xylaria bambusicola]KAI0517548.1 hypothetical protein F5B22DRAFT_603349 [Xylaria bambusicola]
MDWTPPPDPDCPQCPYLPGLVIHATEHEPPAAFGLSKGYPRKTRRDPSRDLVQVIPKTAHVLEYPPEETQWSPDKAPPRTATLTITERLANGSDRRAKLVVCRVLVKGHSRAYTAVAKIYDPLYYSPEGLGEAWVVKDADSDYSCEALAYRSLQEPLHPQKPGFTPDYYGSWTFDSVLTHQNKAYKRSIRLILIEHIQGTSMRNLYTSKHPDSEPDAFHYDEAYRLAVLAELCEGWVKQIHGGINQRDLAPRNVMLAPSPQEGITPAGVPRVVLIDYNAAVVYEHHYLKPFPVTQKSLPPNPGDYFWNDDWSPFIGWCPKEWNNPERRKELAQRWLSKTFLQNETDFVRMTEEP